MGRASRQKPERLAEKLKQIREVLGISQDGMIIKLKLLDTAIKRSDISNFELGVNEPSLIVLLAYARSVNVYLDVLADDDLDLPEKLPARKRAK